MAGLAVVCADLPEWRRIGDEHGHCLFVERPEPALIAHRINSLTSDTIERMKQKALQAAQLLCWETEQEVLIQAYIRCRDSIRS